MKTSTIRNKIVIPLIWIILWHIASVIISQEILLVSPLKVLTRFFELVQTSAFYIAIYTSLYTIFLGFLLALVFGTLLAIYSHKYKIIYDFFIPVMSFIKVTPVASFIIMALFWIKTDYLSTLIAFLITIPVFFINIYTGLKSVDPKMLEMGKIFNFSRKNTINHIYIPSLQPFFMSSVSIGISMSFKSGVAGEVIAISRNTIGGRLQNAKVILETADVFCYTITVVIVSILVEKLTIKFINHIVEVINHDKN